MENPDLEEMRRMVNFAHETSALSLHLLCRLLPILERTAGVSPVAAETIHTCLLRLENLPNEFREQDLERMRLWRKGLDAESAGS